MDLIHEYVALERERNALLASLTGEADEPTNQILDAMLNRLSVIWASLDDKERMEVNRLAAQAEPVVVPGQDDAEDGGGEGWQAAEFIEAARFLKSLEPRFPPGTEFWFAAASSETSRVLGNGSLGDLLHVLADQVSTGYETVEEE